MLDFSVFQNRKVAYCTLGCKLNFAETSSIGKQLRDAGFSRTVAGEQADVCVINTCTVTDVADHKSRQAINRMHRLHPQAVVIVVGCYAQLKPDEIAQLDGVDLVLGTNEKFNILEYLQNIKSTNNAEKIHTSKINSIDVFKPSCSADDRTRYFLKIQDGCDYYCTYCTIPFARGKSRSASVAATLQEAQRAIDAGAKEIVLTGVNIGDFGKQHNESFFQFLQALSDIGNNVRYRISSIEPNLLTDEIIEFVAKSKNIMPHFHIPLQSGSDRVLELMKRRYRRELFAQKIATIRSLMPNAFIGVDVITGVRGENIDCFEDSYNFINSLNITQLHIFTYSERASTKMLEITEIVPVEERKRRSEILHNLSARKTEEFYQQNIGKTVNVLWESRKKGETMTGFSENYVRCECPYNAALRNTIQQVTLAGWNSDKTALQVL
ncbi:MAG: tRNA (N(6)-L-threonylcarbamoyladenosine(37)-C(2))-methylthiotransferase MtaB [Paludibacter sp.]|jgi:threonylcarbamoyladenosine tRNA methylthiotransferase MtaB|nr:tRNA (N(6)-L-threonylcarbamoyladenosine(37)-C(2))-methylthiotransferase MtaB [Paludibacter sp.]